MRRAKQIIYGVFYFIVLAGIFTLFYVRFLKPAPAAPCADCLPAGLKPITAGTVLAFTPTLGHVTFLVRVANWNTEVGADSFGFTIAARDASGTPLGSISGSSFAYPDETKYIVLPNEAVSGTVAAADFTLGAVHWIASSTAGAAPQFSFKNVLTAPAPGNIFAASGDITDDDNSAFSNITIIAIFKDQYGNPAGVSQTVLDSIQPQQTENFSVSYPASAAISPSVTEVHAYAWR